ncbi:hypothetical protein ACFU7Y_06130 [Kitasatospora sp. NPDC057542]|uniref:hypothetical protein n=1 Tax=Streptomycetaceae TaxID=2062 RepID=UPI001CCC9D44|nr:hypothetical protein [Streptomyces sp. LS1784]
MLVERRSTSSVLCGLRPGGTGHAPGRIAVNLLVRLVDGCEAIADPALPRGRGEVPVPPYASPSEAPSPSRSGRRSAAGPMCAPALEQDGAPGALATDDPGAMRIVSSGEPAFEGGEDVLSR